jgi:hypothetical protein
MRRGLSFALVPLLSAGCGGIEPRSTFIRPILTGTWPVTFSALANPGGPPCTLSGVTLVLAQQEGRETTGGGWQASLQGTYGPGTLACGSAAPVSQAGGTLSGSLDGPRVTLTLSSGSRLEADRIIGPEYNVITLRGPALWISSTGATLSGEWTGGPIVTPTLPPS